MKSLGLASVLLLTLATACGGPQDPLKAAATSVRDALHGRDSTSETPPTEPACPEIACDMRCAHGFAADENGCPTCSCVEQDCSAITDESTCHATRGCEAVFHDGEDPDHGGGVGCGMGAPTTTVRFECCTVTADGIHCGGDPQPQDCRTLGCGPGFECEGTGACPAVDCACVTEPCDCGAMPPCETTYACVPVNTGDCRTSGCAEGETCQAGPVCEIACDCDPSRDVDCACPPCAEPTWSCVPAENPCNLVDCAAGETCQATEMCPVVAVCDCPAGDATCECPLSPPCQLVAQCVPVQPDPCAALDETQCLAASDRCVALYTGACPDCAQGGECPPCNTGFGGCVSPSVDGGAGGGTQPGTPAP